VRRLVDAVGASLVFFVAYSLVGDDMHTLRGVAIFLLLVLGAVELIAALYRLASEDLSGPLAAQGLGGVGRSAWVSCSPTHGAGLSSARSQSASRSCGEGSSRTATRRPRSR
jgi:hypothetical protein